MGQRARGGEREEGAPGVAAGEVLEELRFAGEADGAVDGLARDVDEEREDRRAGVCLQLSTATTTTSR